MYMYEIQTFRQSVITKGLLFNDVVMLKSDACPALILSYEYGPQKNVILVPKSIASVLKLLAGTK